MRAARSGQGRPRRRIPCRRSRAAAKEPRSSTAPPTQMTAGICRPMSHVEATAGTAAPGRLGIHVPEILPDGEDELNGAGAPAAGTSMISGGRISAANTNTTRAPKVAASRRWRTAARARRASLTAMRAEKERCRRFRQHHQLNRSAEGENRLFHYSGHDRVLSERTRSISAVSASSSSVVHVSCFKSAVTVSPAEPPKKTRTSC